MTKTKAQQNYIPRDGREGAGTSLHGDTERKDGGSPGCGWICWKETHAEYRAGAGYNFPLPQTEKQRS